MYVVVLYQIQDVRVWYDVSHYLDETLYPSLVNVGLFCPNKLICLIDYRTLKNESWGGAIKIRLSQ